jgi:hypothetical protein
MDFVPDEEVSDEEGRPPKKKLCKTHPTKPWVKNLKLEYDDELTRMYVDDTDCMFVEYLIEGEPDKVMADVKREFPPLWYHTQFTQVAEGTMIGMRLRRLRRPKSDYKIVDRSDHDIYPKDVECNAVVYLHESFGRWGEAEFKIAGDAKDVDAVIKRVMVYPARWGYFGKPRTLENGTIGVIHLDKNCD